MRWRALRAHPPGPSSHTLLRRLRQRGLVHRLKTTTTNAPLELECEAGDLALLVLREVHFQEPQAEAALADMDAPGSPVFKPMQSGTSRMSMRSAPQVR